MSPINQLLIFLRFCATGTHLLAVADFAGVHFSTASRIVARVSRVIAHLYVHHVKMPQNENEIIENQLDFFRIARFPRVIGVIDCTHVRIQSPGRLLSYVITILL